MTAEKEYAINFSKQQKELCLSLHYNAANCYLFAKGVEICKFKAKDSKINAPGLCFGKVSKDFSTGNMKKTGLYGYIYEFLVDYDSTDVDDILYIHLDAW